VRKAFLRYLTWYPLIVKVGLRHHLRVPLSKHPHFQCNLFATITDDVLRCINWGLGALGGVRTDDDRRAWQRIADPFPTTVCALA